VKLTVGTTPVRLPVHGAPVIQNLGPGVLYMDASETVDVNTGIRIPVGQAYEFTRTLEVSSGALFLVATQTTDVRCMEVG